METETVILLEEGWFIEGDYGATVKNLIKAFDKGYMENCKDVDKFAEGTFREIVHLSTYPNEELDKVREYIFANALDLFEYAKEVVAKK